jgi:plasmid stability protein
MKQLTLRVPDDLAADLTAVAAEHGQSVNAFATVALRAAVDPDAAGDEVERMRERLRRAGLELYTPTRAAVAPDPEAVAAARAALASGQMVSDIVSEQRD